MSQEKPQGVGRRRLLFGGAAAGLGAVAAAGAQWAGNSSSSEPDLVRTGLDEGGANGAQTVPFYGRHQAGIATEPQTHASFVALDLGTDVSRDRIRSWLRLLSDDAAALTQGQPALADTEAELAVRPARLSVTFGFGPGLVKAVAPHLAPPWLAPLPGFGIDALQERWNGGDLLLQICADDPLTVAHAQRMLLKDSRAFAAVRWIQSGFRRAYGSEQTGTTMRNLFGQVDGSANPVPGTAEFDRVVWGDAEIPAWLDGGTSMVIRRIAMNLDTWDELDRHGREESVGRTLANGAPLTGSAEHDAPDFEAVTALGFPVIPDYSHMRRARPDNPRQRILRRSYNYDDAPEPGGPVSNAGQVFVSFQADVSAQFLPIQERLDKLDLLNEWTTPIGSAVFAVPPGAREGGFVGEALFG
ncbi:Dyp-type peroxidase [Arthrobacter sunyaminii]|uniref:Dyp-type peroxidase n=1 Tax=Arthrobacter sunyaminii TaxID=2816859 RepID=A0A975PFU4_9MICC|nr:Dyp-type peroxidase [Arthrobacter sunyaminii]MBO0908669.1 Dyp-type peroxidase [Arthrobacter sunyaminii]QWQ35807.1 Dyp-type peroxidase [Arthrobacter sunyaminii]